MTKMARGHLAAFITILIWGTTFISTKILLKDFQPIEILFIRFALGFLILLLVYPKVLHTTHKKHEITFALAGLCGVCLYYLLENIALTYTLAANVGVIVALAPFFTAIVSHLILKDEPLKVNFFIGFFVAIVGICCMSFNGVESVEINPIGDVLALIAALVWAFYSVLTKKISEFGYNTIQSTRKVFGYGLIFMIPVLFIFGFDVKISSIFVTINVFNLFYLGIGASALCFVTWNYAVKILGAVKTSVYIYIVPAITVITSVIILHERITILSCLGVILTMMGLLISEYRSKKQTSLFIKVCNCKGVDRSAR